MECWGKKLFKDVRRWLNRARFVVQLVVLGLPPEMSRHWPRHWPHRGHPQGDPYSRRTYARSASCATSCEPLHRHHHARSRTRRVWRNHGSGADLQRCASSRWCRGQRLVAAALRRARPSPGASDRLMQSRQAATCAQQQRSPGYPPHAALFRANQANICTRITHVLVRRYTTTVHTTEYSTKFIVEYSTKFIVVY